MIPKDYQIYDQPLLPSQRRELKDRFWSWIDSSITGYSRQIDDLLDTLNDKQLFDFVSERAMKNDEPDEDE